MNEALPETYVFLQAFAAGQMLLAALLVLLVKTPHQRAARLLAAFIALYGITFLFNLAFHFNLAVSLPAIIPAYVLSYLLLGPAFYGYVRTIIQRQAGPIFPRPLSTALPIVIAAGLSFLWLSYDAQTRAGLMAGSFEPDTPQAILVTLGVLAVQIFMPVQSAVFLCLSIGALHRHHGSIKAFFVKYGVKNRALGQMAGDWIALHLSAGFLDGIL